MDSGKRSWIYRFRAPDGRLRQITLGDAAHMGLSDARKAWGRWVNVRRDPALGDPAAQAESLKKQAVAQAKDREAAEYTLRHLVNDFCAEHLASTAGGAERERTLRRDLPEQLLRRSAREVTRADFMKLLDKVRGRAPRLAEMIRGDLRLAYEHAIERERVPDINPLARIKRIGAYVPRSRSLTDAEIAAVMKWLPTARMSDTIKDVLRLVLLTGCRPGEAASAKWADIDLHRGTWRREAKAMKTRLEHVVPINKQVVALLKARRQKQDEKTTVVFPAPRSVEKSIGEHAHVWQLVQARTLTPLAGMPTWTAHDLRRTCATGLARLGAPRLIIDRILAHSDRSIGAVYDTHGYHDEMRRWLSKWGAHVETLSKATEADVIDLGERRSA
jgi:integrase